MALLVAVVNRMPIALLWIWGICAALAWARVQGL
jgi:hypothetical protein